MRERENEREEQNPISFKIRPTEPFCFLKQFKSQSWERTDDFDLMVSDSK